MSITTEYLKTPCLYCDAITLRRKLPNDWLPGEKQSRGHFPKKNLYLICDSCRRSCCVATTTPLSVLFLTTFQTFLRGFL